MTGFTPCCDALAGLVRTRVPGSLGWFWGYGVQLALRATLFMESFRSFTRAVYDPTL